jgi:mannose-1-phosphate guanylyltransferase/mannose-6-phosphate isomerase
MRDNLRPYVSEDDAAILLALNRIDENKKGFLVVTRGDLFLGTLTDGDIRRAFINGKMPQDSIADIYTRNSVVLQCTDDLPEAADMMSNDKIEFLPIVDSDKKLVNILTKRQLWTVLLCNISADLNFDFCELDESISDHEIKRKPWGFYKTTVLNDFYQSKVLELSPLSSISLQRHLFREEYWLVVFGRGEARVGDSVLPVLPGSFVFIPKGCKHRLRNKSSEQNLIVVEVQLGESFDENDIERINDDYDRV